MSAFRVLKHDVWSDGIRLSQLKGYDEDFLLNTDQSLAASYPKGVTYAVDKSSVTRAGPAKPGRAGKEKASVLLTDSLHNTDDNLVVSERMAALIRERERHVEFLPVQIKGYTEPYFIVNLLAQVACLDVKKSGARKTPGPGGTSQIAGVKKLVILEPNIPPERALFRVKEYPSIILARDTLISEFEAASLTGLDLVAIDAYDES